MRSLLLAVNDWDLVLDASGNIALASEPYALAQDVASAVRTFLGEAWFNDTLGVPYFETILGKSPPLIVFQDALIAAALTVPGVVSATCTITAYEGRTVTGQILFTDSTGRTGTVTI